MSSAATYMDIYGPKYWPRDYHTNWSKSGRERQMSYDIAYMWKLKKWYKWTYLQNQNRLIDLENELVVTSEGRVRGGGGIVESLRLTYTNYYN